MADDEMMTDAPGGGFNWADEVTAEHAASGHDAAVLEAERVKAKKRAERFGQEYKEPKANVVARGLMSRKEVLAMRKEQALKKMNRRGEFVAGIDVFDPEEEAKRAARAAKFGTNAPSALTPEQQAIKDRRDAQDAQRLVANAAALQEAYADAMDDGTGAIAGSADVAQDFFESRVDPEVDEDFFESRVDPRVDASWRSDAVHLYGVDRMTTDDCMGYFHEYGPVFVEWINDSSCNVVFNDEHTARRAVRMKGVVRVQGLGLGLGLEDAALPAGTRLEMLWHSGPEFRKDGRVIQLAFRLATTEDVKPEGEARSRASWRRGGGKRRAFGGGDRHHPYGGDGGGGGGGGRRRRGARGRSDRGGGMRGYDDDDDDDGGVADLRERIRRRKRPDAADAGGSFDVPGDSNPRAVRDRDDGGEVAPPGGVDGTVTGTAMGRDARAARADADDAMRGAVGMMRGALRGATRERATEDGAKLAATAEGDVEMQR